MGEFSLTHWLVIAVVLIVFFGPKRLPQLGQSLGESIRGFKKAMNDVHDANDKQEPVSRREAIQQPQDVDVTHSTTTTTTTKDTTHT